MSSGYHFIGVLNMEVIELGTLIAQRELELIDEGGTKSTIVVRIGMPKKFTDSSDFYAPYMICGIGGEEVWYAAGIDAVQALQLSLKMIGAELNAFRLKLNVDIKWEGDDNGRLGFDD